MKSKRVEPSYQKCLRLTQAAEEALVYLARETGLSQNEVVTQLLVRQAKKAKATQVTQGQEVDRGEG